MAALRLILVLVLCSPAWGADATDASRLFHHQVLPLLQSRCISCHGPDKQKGGLRMDSREALLKGGDSGPALVPGRPLKSLVLQAVLHSKPDLEMPPKEKLSTRDADLLEQWILLGAPWPVEGSPNPGITAPNAENADRIGDAWSDERNPIRRIFRGERINHWALKPVAPATIPTINNVRWARNPIDRFVLSTLEKRGMTPSVEADRRSLVRRLSMDLIGLPPSPDDVEQLLKDRSTEALERYIDRLLESPRFGEHWARLWLDVVRYSDSNGFDWDEFRPQAWRFRDYVVRSLNSDKPFDQFVREQLAGDELLSGPPENQAEQDALIATGYLRLGPQDNSASLFNEQARSRAELMADLVETTGSAFLGLTFSCCRCHDHKTDPLSQADHFRFRAFFEPVARGDDLALNLKNEQEEIRAHNEQVDNRIKPIKERRDSLLARVQGRIKAERSLKLSDEERRLIEIPVEKRPEELKQKIAGIEKRVVPSEKEIKAALNDAERKDHDTLTAELDKISASRRPFLKGLLMTDAAGPVPATKVLYQGDYKAERETVLPGIPSALDPNPMQIPRPRNPATTGRRLALANWVASSSNPWTARVFVNRLWQSLMGRGIVATPNDFGLSGASPSHPELLDWLAADFAGHGWRIKRTIRMIVSSATYRQSSSDPMANPGRDSENLYLARHNLRRLTAEELRDALLFVSRGLSTRMGGEPAWPELPAEVLQANPAFLDDNAERTKGWYPSPASRQAVRSLYLVQKRTVRVPFMETFDMPENSSSCSRRTVSVVAPQALAMLNGRQTAELAERLAASIENECGGVADADERIRELFRCVLQRPPGASELESCRQFLKGRTFPELGRVLVNLNEFLHVD